MKTLTTLGHTIATLGQTLATLLTLSSCVPEPTAPSNTNEPLARGGVYVLCEGLWSQDNAALSYIQPSGNVVKDVVGTYNVGIKLGDTSTDMVMKGDSILIAVSNSRSICVVRRSDGTFLSRLQMPEGREPYQMALGRAGTLFCTNINDDSITEIDATTMSIVVARVPVGPAPEGIACADGKVYVANSGFGDLRKDEQGAGTLSILSEYDLSTIAVIIDLPNVALVESDVQRHRVWVSYRHFATQPDSVGGVVLIDTRSDTIIARWKVKVPTGIAIDLSTGNAYVLSADGIERMDGTTLTTSRVVSQSTGSGNDVWYSIGFDAVKQQINVGNAKSYVTDGEVIVITTDGSIVSRTAVGINPAAFGF